MWAKCRQIMRCLDCMEMRAKVSIFKLYGDEAKVSTETPAGVHFVNLSRAHGEGASLCYLNDVNKMTAKISRHHEMEGNTKFVRKELFSRTHIAIDRPYNNAMFRINVLLFLLLFLVLPWSALTSPYNLQK